MKRKRPAVPVPDTAAAAQPVPQEPTGLSRLDIGKIVLFTLLLFWAVTLQTRAMAMLLVVLALASFLGRGPFRRVRQRACIPVIGLLAFMVMVGLAAIYSHFGDYAVKEVRSVITAHDIDDDAHQGVHGVQGDVRHRDAVPRGEDLRREDAGRARLQLPRVLLVAVGRRGEEDRRDGHGSASFH